MVVFETKRLRARQALAADVDLFFSLWTDPRVMTYVGFPQGLPITRAEIAKTIAGQAGSDVYNVWLVAELLSTGQGIGECKLIPPDEEGIARTDIKLLPQFWGHRYGVEIKRGLLAYLFRHTDCTAVEATPNVNNIASIKMQEAVGGVRVGETLFEFPEEKRSWTTPVHSHIYHVFRSDWESQAASRES